VERLCPTVGATLSHAGSPLPAATERVPVARFGGGWTILNKGIEQEGAFYLFTKGVPRFCTEPAHGLTASGPGPTSGSARGHVGWHPGVRNAGTQIAQIDSSIDCESLAGLACLCCWGAASDRQQVVATTTPRSMRAGTTHRPPKVLTKSGVGLVQARVVASLISRRWSRPR
jgi:hypothetical protein